MKLPLTAYGNVLPSTFWEGIEDVPAKYVDGLSVGDLVNEGHPAKAIEAIICLPETERNNVIAFGVKAGERLATYIRKEDSFYADAADNVVRGEAVNFRELRERVSNTNEEAYNNALVSLHQFKNAEDNLRGLVRRLKVLLANIAAIAAFTDDEQEEADAVAAELTALYPVTDEEA